MFSGAASKRHVHYSAPGGEVSILPAPRLMRQGNSYIQVGANRDFKAGYKRRAAPAQIFAGSFFGEYHAARVAAGNLHRQAHGNPAFSSLP
jgi:hypothetical protein